MNTQFLAQCSAKLLAMENLKGRLRVYSVQWTDECGMDHEYEFYAYTTDAAVFRAQVAARGTEGLNTGISLTDHNGESVDFEPFGGTHP